MPNTACFVIATSACVVVGASIATAQQAAVKFAPNDSIEWRVRPGTNLAQAEIHGSVQKSGLYAVQVKFPKGGKAPPHTHPDERILNVLAGVLYFGTGTAFDETSMKPLAAGSVVIIPPDTPHFVLARDGEVIVQESGFVPSGTKPWPHAAASSK